MPRPVSATEPASESGRYSLPQKRKCGNLVAAAETLPGCSRSDYSKIWFGLKKKEHRNKDNAPFEAQGKGRGVRRDSQGGVEFALPRQKMTVPQGQGAARNGCSTLLDPVFDAGPDLLQGTVL